MVSAPVNEVKTILAKIAGSNEEDDVGEFEHIADKLIAKGFHTLKRLATLKEDRAESEFGLLPGVYLELMAMPEML